MRHALPGERVVAEVTEVHRGYAARRRGRGARALAGPGRAAVPVRRHRAAAAAATCSTSRRPRSATGRPTVVREQLARLAGFTDEEIADLGVRVTALPAAPDLLGWRSRVRYAVDAAGRAGLLKHRSHEVVPIDRCLIAHPSIQDLAGARRAAPAGAEAVETVASSAGDVVIRELPTDEPAPVVREVAAGRAWSLPSDAFWQVHPAAADTLATAVLDLARAARRRGRLGPVRRRRALRRRAGPPGRAGRPGHARRVVAGGRVRRPRQPARPAVGRGRRRPRRGGARQAAGRRAGRRRRARPAAHRRRRAGRPHAGARPAPGRSRTSPAIRPPSPGTCATFRDEGWRLAALRGFDCFPMTQHIELVGLILPAGPVT